MTATIDRAGEREEVLAPPSVESRGGRRGAVATSVAVVGALVASQAIGAAYSQNQNTYLVRAVAGSSDPALRVDRLVRSADPTPVFTWVSRTLISLGDGPGLLYGAWAAAAVALFGGLLWATTDIRRSTAATVVWGAAVAAVGSPTIALLDATVLAKPLEGLAGQYALGPVWQPSCAGVLVLLGTVAASRRGVRAGPVALMLAGAILHPTYLLVAAVLVAGLLVAHRGPTLLTTVRPAAGGLATAALGLVVLAVADRSSFAGVTDPLSDDGNRILAFERIPHHADPATWLSDRDVAMVVVVGLAVWVARRRPEPAVRALGTALGVATALSAALGAVAVASGSPSLLLGFPWRSSVVIVPLAVALLVAIGADALVELVRRHAAHRVAIVTVAAAALLGCAAVGGVRDSSANLGDPPADGAVVTALVEGDAHGTGLIPPGRGASPSMGQIPDDIRLNAGLPVFVDWKNNPNEPTEIVAWRDRIDAAEAAMASSAALCDLIEAEGLTWAVVPAEVADGASDACLRGWTTHRAVDAVVAIAP